MRKKANLMKIQNYRFDVAMLSPIFITSSHPLAKPTGVSKVNSWAGSSKIACYGLGGINKENINYLKGGELSQGGCQLRLKSLMGPGQGFLKFEITESPKNYPTGQKAAQHE